MTKGVRECSNIDNMIQNDRKLIIFLSRAVPISLIAILLVLGVYERNIRVRLQQEMDLNTERLIGAENRLQGLNEELSEVRYQLDVARVENDKATREKDFLVSQLGLRDDHIRRLLGQLVQVLSGKTGIDLGTIKLNEKNDKWVKLQSDMQSFLEAPPLTHQLPQVGMRQTQVELQTMNMPMPLINTQLIPAPTLPQANTEKIIPQNQTTKPIAMPIGDKLSLLGEILVVNPDHNFVVIDKGAEHGMRKGMNIAILRDNRVLGYAIVDTAYAKISAATVQQGPSSVFQVGDHIQLKA